MTHQPYEDWLFSEEPLAPQQAAALREHLEVCPTCRALSAAWQEVREQLQAAPVIEPAPGFAYRWEARLEADRKRLQRRQTLAMLSFSIGGAVLILASAVLLLLPLIWQPQMLVLIGATRILSAVNFLEGAREFVSSVLNISFGSFSLVWIVLLLGLVSLMAVLWVVSLRLLTNPRRVTK